MANNVLADRALAAPAAAAASSPNRASSPTEPHLSPAEDFAVWDGDPAVSGGGPFAPCGRDLLEVRGGGQIQAHQIAGHGRMKDSVGPHATPPFARLGCGIAPQAAARRDVVESRLLCPGQQAPARVGFPRLARATRW